MSIRPEYTVFCDGQDCALHYENSDVTRTKAWQRARAEGWVARNREHYCPACAAKGLPPVEKVDHKALAATRKKERVAGAELARQRSAELQQEATKARAAGDAEGAKKLERRAWFWAQQAQRLATNG